MAKIRRYNSDFMSRQMDERLELLEEDLTALYARAVNDVKAEFTDWTAKNDKKEKEMNEKLKNGDITEEEFSTWRKNAYLKDQRYKETINSMTDILVNTDKAAMAIVRGELPLVVAESFNFTQALGFAAADEAGLTVGTFQVYNARSVQKLIKDNPDLLPRVDVSEDKKWNKKRINREITQGIIKGEPLDKVADRLQNVTDMDRSAAVRNARTAMTGAENLGRDEGFHELKDKGIPARMQWSATHDSRTRDTHIMLDGTYQDENGYFGEGILATPIQYPGDPAGDPEEIYNCRCRASLVLEGIDHSQDDDLYEKFMKDNYPEDWEQVKKDREDRESAYSSKKEGAPDRVKARNERRRNG